MRRFADKVAVDPGFIKTFAAECRDFLDGIDGSAVPSDTDLGDVIDTIAESALDSDDDRVNCEDWDDWDDDVYDPMYGPIESLIARNALSIAEGMRADFVRAAFRALADDPRAPSVGAIDVAASPTVVEEVERLRALGWSAHAIDRELRRQGRIV